MIDRRRGIKSLRDQYTVTPTSGLLVLMETEQPKTAPIHCKRHIFNAFFKTRGGFSPPRPPGPSPVRYGRIPRCERRKRARFAGQAPFAPLRRPQIPDDKGPRVQVSRDRPAKAETEVVEAVVGAVVVAKRRPTVPGEVVPGTAT